MIVVEIKQYRRDYLDPDKRTNANSVLVHLKVDHLQIMWLWNTRLVSAGERLLLLVKKYEESLRNNYGEEQAELIMGVCMDHINTTHARSGKIIISATGAGTVISKSDIEVGFSTSGTLEEI